MTKKVLLITILFSIMALSVYAATLEETLQSLSGDAAKNYVNPMVTSFGSDMNGGWFHKAPKAKFFGWDFEFGFVVMATMFTDDDKTFDVNGRFNFTRAQAEQIAASYSNAPFYDALVDKIVSQSFTVGIAGPTITGESYNETTGENSINVYFPSQNITFNYMNTTMTQPVPASTQPIPFGGLLADLPALPLAAPQMSIGTLYGTQLSFRYLPDTELTPEIGKLKYMGYGIQHNPGVWMPFKMPVNVALAFFTQQMDIGDLVETSASTYGLNVSKTFGLKLLSVTPYAGFAGESSNMKFHYDYPTGSTAPGVPEKVKINFDVEGKNTSRLTAGLSFRLALINLNFDYSLAKYPSASMGMMLNFGW